MFLGVERKGNFKSFCSEFATNFHLTGCFYLLFQSLLAYYLPFTNESNEQWFWTGNERMLITGKCRFGLSDPWIEQRKCPRRCHFHWSRPVDIDWSLVLSLDFACSSTIAHVQETRNRTRVNCYFLAGLRCVELAISIDWGKNQLFNLLVCFVLSFTTHLCVLDVLFFNLFFAFSLLAQQRRKRAAACLSSGFRRRSLRT